MDRKFLLAALVFMLLLTGYNQFVVLPRAQKQQQAAEQALAQTKQEMAATAVFAQNEIIFYCLFL